MKGDIRCFSVSPSDALLAVGIEDESTAWRDKCISLYNWSTGERIRTFLYASWADSIAFSFDNRRLVSGHFDHAVNIWDINDSRPLRVFNNHTGHVGQVRFHPRGEFFATCADDSSIRLWHLEKKTPLVTAIAREKETKAYSRKILKGELLYTGFEITEAGFVVYNQARIGIDAFKVEQSD